MTAPIDPRDLAAEEASQRAVDAEKEEPREGIKEGLHFDLPNDDYHSLTDWYSSTQLKRALPEQYKEGGSQEALDFGKLFHGIVLEPDNLDEFVVADPFEIGVKKDGSRATNPTNTDAWRDFVAETEAAGRTIISPEWWERAHLMRDAVMAHGEARELVFSDDGQSEVSAFAADGAGIKHKARFDRLYSDRAVSVDLKSTFSQPGEHHLTKAVIKYGYELSAAHYLTVAQLLDLKVYDFTLVFVEKAEPYRVTVADLDALLIRRGRDLREKAMDRLLGNAEPYDGATGRLYLTCPNWALPDDLDMEIH